MDVAKCWRIGSATPVHSGQVHHRSFVATSQIARAVVHKLGKTTGIVRFWILSALRLSLRPLPIQLIQVSIRSRSPLYITAAASSGTSPHNNSRLRGRSPAAKDRVRISPPPPTSPLKMDPRPLPLLRRRRVLLPLFTLALLCFFLFSPTHDLFGLPPALQGLRNISPASISALRFMRPRVDEIHGLLFYAVHQKEGLAHAPDPTHPLDLSVYADGDPTPDWPSRVKHLDSEAPLIVFSKTYCSFSQRAKDLILRYDLVPPPKIIEVDLRDDGDFIKAVLTRLTGRNTFPNVFLRGKSIGGSDDIAAMHKDGRLRQVFEKADLQVRAEIKDEEA